MKKLAIKKEMKKPIETIQLKSEIINHANNDAYCDFCHEDQKPGIISPFPMEHERIRIETEQGRVIKGSFDIQRVYGKCGALGSSEYVRTIEDYDFKDVIKSVDRQKISISPVICFDCIKQLAKQIKK